MGEKGSKAFIAAMAPTATTVDGFWRILCQCKVNLVVQLCPEEEQGKEMCFNYYEPTSAPEGGAFKFGGRNIQLKGRKTPLEGLITRKLAVEDGDRGFTLTHIQETMWPDNKAPGTRDDCGPSEAFKRINYLIDKIEKHRLRNPQGSVLVHCR